MPAIPDRLQAALSDRYRFERELGRGGMATVYLAEDLKHRRKVAIKVLRAELAAVLGAERFLQEITTTAALQHPHILPLFDSGEAGGFLFYVMPFVEGESLRDRLFRHKQLPVSDAISIARNVALALDYAHRHGVVHRDIKPENILLHDGNALVADFGIALAVDAAGGQRLTETGMAIGTPAYMSPEQSAGDASVDGRCDVYSLGCVLYEMLAGEPPFTGPTAQAVIAKRLTQPAPSVRTLRETVPEAVDRALVSALARTAADRFATARAFAEALAAGGGEVIPTPAAMPARRVPVARWLGAACAVLLLAIAALGIIRWRRGAAKPLDPNLMVIVPFDALDPALSVWSEGVVDLLSRTLDGAGSLRTVSPSVVLFRWQGRSDRASAMAVAHRVGAGLAATGSLSRRGEDSVEVRAALLDIQRGEVIGEVGVIGATARVAELVDSLGLELLRTLSRDRPVAAVRQAAIGSAPLPALKSFLRGEQFYRRSLYDSALPYYAEAIARDSGFTLAWYRMGKALSWNPPTAGAYGPYEEFTAQAFVRNHGLSVRDSLIISADSALDLADPWIPEVGRLGWDRLDTLVRRYPRDPEAWYMLGEALYHADYGFGQDHARALDAFDRAIELDSSFTPAWEHVPSLALRLGRKEMAARYLRAAEGLPATSEGTLVLGFVSRLLLDTTGRSEAGMARALDSAGATTLYRAAFEHFYWLPDSNETAVALLRRLDELKLREGESAAFIVDSLMRHQYVAVALAQRGHLREAYRVNRRLIEDPAASSWSGWADPFVTLALLGAIPADQAERAFAPGLQAGMAVTSASRRSLAGLPWWAMRRDTLALKLFGQRMREAASHASSARDRMRIRYLQLAADGYLALVRGDSAAALSRFSILPDSACGLVRCTDQRIVEASLLAARGDDLRAASILDDILTQTGLADAVLARLARGRIAERLNDRETAILSYGFVVDAWRRSDPELSAYVAEAREGLARLSEEPK